MQIIVSILYEHFPLSWCVCEEDRRASVHVRSPEEWPTAPVASCMHTPEEETLSQLRLLGVDHLTPVITGNHS